MWAISPALIRSKPCTGTVVSAAVEFWTATHTHRGGNDISYDILQPYPQPSLTTHFLAKKSSLLAVYI